MSTIPLDISERLDKLETAILNASAASDDALYESLRLTLRAYYDELLAHGRWHPSLTETVADFTDEAEESARLYAISLEQSLAYPDELTHTKMICQAERLIELGRCEEARGRLLEGRAEAQRRGDDKWAEQADLLANRLASLPASDAQLLVQFESARWPLADWHHRQHIKVAYLYLCEHPFDVAMDRIRARIKAYNAAHKVPEGPTSGYHETMTKAWMRLVHFTLCEYGPAKTADDFYSEHPQLHAKKVLRLFYSRELLESERAKREFVEPDLAPLPKPRGRTR